MFKVGDKVEVVKSCRGCGASEKNCFLGDVGIVKEIIGEKIGVNQFVKSGGWCSGFMEDCLKLVELSEEEKKKREQEEEQKEKEEMIKENEKEVISVSGNVHNRLAKTLKFYHTRDRIGLEATPVCYMLGKDDRGVIVNFVSLMPWIEEEHCKNMPTISGTSMANAMIKLCQRALVPCGIARVGDFDLGGDGRGDSLQEIRNMSGGRGIIISYSKKGVRVERLMKSGIKEYVYNVVEERR